MATSHRPRHQLGIGSQSLILIRPRQRETRLTNRPDGCRVASHSYCLGTHQCKRSGSDLAPTSREEFAEREFD